MVEVGSDECSQQAKHRQAARYRRIRHRFRPLATRSEGCKTGLGLEGVGRELPISHSVLAVKGSPWSARSRSASSAVGTRERAVLPFQRWRPRATNSYTRSRIGCGMTRRPAMAGQGNDRCRAMRSAAVDRTWRPSVSNSTRLSGSGVVGAWHFRRRLAAADWSEANRTRCPRSRRITYCTTPWHRAQPPGQRRWKKTSGFHRPAADERRGPRRPGLAFVVGGP